MPSPIRIQAPAKLNIRLKITGRRPDGYHELDSIMVPVSLFDHLELSPISEKRIILTCHGLRIPADEENLVCRAAQAFFSLAGINQGLSISLTKRIPVAAGLGGGSSDAACMLKALNEMWALPLSPQDLEELALRLGADVPFFLLSRPCRAKGIGEILEPIKKWPEFWYVIVSPRFHVSTSWVYRNLNLRLTTNEYASILSTLDKAPFEVADILENDLEKVTAFRFPVINTIKKHLKDAGAEGSLMSGSGPSTFGIFRSKDQALSAKRHLTSKDLGDIFVVAGFSEHAPHHKNLGA
jgi:4-diphosphocytidyl-2-C-methyl-D-erythritol kinase